MDDVILIISEKYSLPNVSKFKYKIINPSLQEKREKTEQNKGAKWLVDTNYFNVTQIEFRLSKGEKNLHDNFWNELSSLLARL